ncbi:MAG: SpoIIE family protein phosphatase [candidate division Zixibacteria bacterium]|nr:SpoIIE family protein phosphatase [candidate division Zixibacteria bacterium]
MLLLAFSLWGGVSFYFTLNAPKSFQQALDGADWKPARGGLVPTNIRPEGPADRAGLILTDTLLAANGVSISNEGTLQEVIDRIPIGRRAIYTVRRGDHLIKLEVPIEWDWTGVILHWPLKLGGFLYIFLGIFVFVKKPGLPTARVFLFFTGAAGSLLAMSWVSTTGMSDIVQLLFNLWIVFNACFVGAFSLDFMRRLMFFAPPNSPAKGLTRLTYLPALSIALFYFLPIAIALTKGEIEWPTTGPWRQFQPYMIPALYGIYLVWFITEITLRTRKKEFVLNPRQGAWLQWGMGLPMSIFVIFGIILPAFFNNSLLRWSLLGLMPPPIILSYLILKDRMMDVGVVVKRSLIYAILSAFLIGTFVLLVMATSQLVVFLTGQESRLAVFAAALLTAVAGNLYRERVQNYLDRSFFKERHNYQKALLEFSQELSRLERLDTLLAKISKQFVDTLHVTNCLPFILDQKTESYEVVSPYGLTDPVLEKVRFSGSEFGLATLLAKKTRPLELYDLETNPLFAHLPVAEKVALKKMEAALAVPLLLKEKLVGMLLFGNKKSGDHFNSEDVDFFAAFSASLAVVVENSRLYKEELEKHEMERELDVARQIQERLVACCRLPELSGVDVATTYLPSKQVSGDLFTVLPVKGDKLALAVGDVAGKGVPASLLMATVQSSLTTLVEQRLSPAEIMQRLNRLVHENTESQHFVTFFLGLFDTETRRLTYVNAGHNPPLYFPPGGKPKELAEGGLLLGIMPEARYEVGEILLHKNAPLVLYTDGITEAENHSEEQFGTERLTETVEQNRHLPAKELGERILSGLKSFCDGRELGDDVSLVILKTV